MKTIYKYELPVSDHFVLEMPLGARVLTVQIHRERPYIWVLADANQTVTESRHFCCIGTGHPIEENGALNYIGTFKILVDTLVFHLFEENVS